MQYKVVLICGSRSIRQSWFCEVIVKSLISQNVKIIVGDAPGIDEVVINTCIKHNYRNIVVVGAYNKIRRYQVLKNNLTVVKYPSDFLSRNRYMVSLASSVIGIWDGLSRGTKYTLEYARKQGKEVIVVIQKS
jgi:predicted Rossmann fold nucleotide-binding protein DprA/Smf involved in DNA uptake